MKKINNGGIRNGEYVKQVEFSKAILWKDRCISLPKHVIDKIVERNIEVINFEDVVKNERMTISVSDFMARSEYKKVGQEPQYYCNIRFFKNSYIDQTRVPEKPKIKQSPVTASLF